MPQNDAIVHVIDDEEAVRSSLGFFLETLGFKVHLYASADAFLEALPQRVRGCIITDVRMPGIDGIELLRRLRAMGQTAPVIVISGHGDVQMFAEAMECGALCCINKPPDDDAVFGAVLAMAGFVAESHDFGLTLPKTTEEGFDKVLAQIAGMTIDPLDVAAFVSNIQSGKFAEFVPRPLAERLWARQNVELVAQAPALASALACSGPSRPRM